MTNNEILYCIGCGAKLQDTQKESAGYLPERKLQKYLQSSSNQELYCQRCFRLRNYNEVASVPLDDSHFQQLLTQIGNKRALVVYVVDIFNFSGSVIKKLQQYIGNNPVLLVGNKVDLVPSSFKRGRLMNWLQHQAKVLGLHPVDTQLVSAKKLTNIDELLVKIDKLRHQRDVYIVGTTNVGKSTLVNAIIRAHSGWQNLITTSNFPGTTLNEIRLPLAEGGELIDTPGIIHDNQIAKFLNKQELKYISPQNEIHPRIFQLQAQQTIFLAGLARLDFIAGSKASFIVYVDNQLYVHRTKLNQADDFYKRHLGELLMPPIKGQKLPLLQAQSIKTTIKSDIVFSGLGWITVPEQIQIKAYLPQGLKVEVRPALIN